MEIISLLSVLSTLKHCTSTPNKHYLLFELLLSESFNVLLWKAFVFQTHYILV